MATRHLRSVTAAVLVALLLCGGAVIALQRVLHPTTITAVFTTATSIYPEDEVRIAGVKVGTITAIEPDGTQARLTMKIEHGINVSADAKAIIVAQNLVSARFVQLAPAYHAGPRLPDGAVIPLDRTAVPVEWDEVKRQLTRLATDLGPVGDLPGAAGGFIDSAADAMAGNGEKLRQTLAQLSGLARILANGSGNIVDILSNLQTFVSVLRNSNEQIVQFQDRLATLTGVVNGGKSDLDAALTNLSQAVGEVTRFVHNTRDKTSEQVQRLANVAQNLVDHRMDLEQVLHVAPSAIANSYNMFDPRSGGASGVFVLNNFANPTQFFCGMIGAVENVTAPETAKLCAQYFGPALNRLNFNYLPFPVNPLLTSVPSRDQLIYSEPKLEPGAGGDVAAPVAPLAPVTPPADLPGLLLPAEEPQP